MCSVREERREWGSVVWYIEKGEIHCMMMGEGDDATIK
jgi:hypothetical protein